MPDVMVTVSVMTGILVFIMVAEKPATAIIKVEVLVAVESISILVNTSLAVIASENVDKIGDVAQMTLVKASVVVVVMVVVGIGITG